MGKCSVFSFQFEVWNFGVFRHDGFQSGGLGFGDGFGGSASKSGFGTDEVGVVQGLNPTKRVFGNLVRHWVFHESWGWGGSSIQ